MDDAKDEGSVSPDATTRDAARQMARDALALMHEERWNEAASLLARAYRLVPAPTIAVLEGRALEHMGRLAAAADAYARAEAVTISEDSPKAFRDAVRDAQEARARLEPRVPRLTVLVEGRSKDSRRVNVSVDGVELPLRELGAPLRVDPGERVVTAAVGGGVVVQDHVLLKEGETKQVVLSLSGTEEASVTHVAPSGRDATGSSASSVAGFVALGVGGAGMGVGVVAGVLMLDAKSTLDSRCSPTCPPELAGEISRFRTTRTVSAAGYATGVVGIGLGAALLLLSPDAFGSKTGRPSRPQALSFWVGGQALGVEGAF